MGHANGLGDIPAILITVQLDVREDDAEIVATFGQRDRRFPTTGLEYLPSSIAKGRGNSTLTSHSSSTTRMTRPFASVFTR
jgi:hypothetical protein